MDRKKFGRRLQQVRMEQHLTGEQFAEKADLSVTYIRQIEGGKRVPSFTTFVKMLNVLECSADYLLAGTVAASQDIVLDELSAKLKRLSPERLAEVTTVIDAMLSYME
ncbi:MAG: helix-turn-helix domain-containing protein [Firmicutes bacterium]|nr:helix-turn-helix domain-containing protein [Bacillota bacterium]